MSEISISMQLEWYLSQISLLFPCYTQLIPNSMTVHYSSAAAAATGLPMDLLNTCHH